MVVLIPRAPRVATALAVTVQLLSEPGEVERCRPLAATMDNFSQGGCCLYMRRLLDSGYHIFYQALQNSEFFLRIQGELPYSAPYAFSLIAVPIWMRAAEGEGATGFQVGVKFKASQPDLLRRMKRINTSRC